MTYCSICSPATIAYSKHRGTRTATTHVLRLSHRVFRILFVEHSYTLCPEAISHLCQSASSQSQMFPQHQHNHIPAHQIPMHITFDNKSLFAAQILNTPSSRIPHMNEANTNSPLKNVSFASKSRTNYNDTSPN